MLYVLIDQGSEEREETRFVNVPNEFSASSTESTTALESLITLGKPGGSGFYILLKAPHYIWFGKIPVELVHSFFSPDYFFKRDNQIEIDEKRVNLLSKSLAEYLFQKWEDVLQETSGKAYKRERILYGTQMDLLKLRFGRGNLI